MDDSSNFIDNISFYPVNRDHLELTILRALGQYPGSAFSFSWGPAEDFYQFRQAVLPLDPEQTQRLARSHNFRLPLAVGLVLAKGKPRSKPKVYAWAITSRDELVTDLPITPNSDYSSLTFQL